MTALIRSLFLAALLATGTAFAQQQTTDNPDNPHSTKAKDKQSSGVSGSDTKQQVQQGETANPHSVDNRKGESKPSGHANVEPAQKQNPHNPNETWNSNDRSNSDSTSVPQGQMGQHGERMGHGEMMKNATPQMMLQMLHHSNQHELEMAKMAQQKGTDRVKSYAQTLQQDHQMADQQVKDLAKKKGITLSDTPRNPEAQQHEQMMKQRFSDLKGAQFDSAFANAMANEHRHVISMAQNWKQNCQDQDVCGLFDSLLPKLQQHEQLATQLRGPAAQGRAPETPSR